MKKFIIHLGLLLLVSQLMLINPARVEAESGLSAAASLYFYKLDDNYAIDVEAGSAGGNNRIQIYRYTENPQYNESAFLGSNCQGKYVPDERFNIPEVIFTGKTFITGDFVYDEQQIYNLNTHELYGIYNGGGTQVNDRILAIIRSGGNLDYQNFNLDYIKKHYQPLDMNNLQEFSCGIGSYLAVLCLVPAVCIILSTCMIIAFILKKKAQKS